MATEAMRYLVRFQFEETLRSDLDLTFESERRQDAWSEARRLPGVDYAEPVLQVPCTMENGPRKRKGSITGLLASARLTVPRDVEGRPLRIPTHGLLMTRKTAELLNVSPGDSLTVTPMRGERRRLRIPVSEIAESYLGTSVYTDIHFLSHLMGEEMALSGVQLTVDPRPAARRLLDKQLKELPALLSAVSRADMIKNINEVMLETQNISIAILVLFAGVIFFGSLLNASLVSLAERMREVATLRAIGYGPWQIGSLLLRESLLVNLIGTLCGLPLGYVLYLAMMQAYDMELIRLPIAAPPWVWTWTLVLAAIFALAAHGVVQWRIHRMDWTARLKVSE
jgi:putative ABC transport system permease protein